MRNIFLLSLFTLLLYPVNAQCYILNGLDYQGGGSLFEFKSYNEITAKLEGTETRLATVEEIVNLFENFNLSIGSNKDVDVDLLSEFVQSFPISSGALLFAGNPSYSPYQYSVSIIAGRLQMEDNQTTVSPCAKLEIIRYGDKYDVSVSISDYPILNVDGGITAWTVTPVQSAPEPSALLLFGAGLLGLSGVARRKMS